MTYIQHNSPFAKQKGGGTTKTCLPASKLRSMSKKQREKLESLFEVEESLHILIMNVEALSTEKGRKFAEKFMSCHETMVAIDESTLSLIHI